MKKREICLILCMLLLVAVLSACTEKQTSATPEPTAMPTAVATVEPTAETTAGPSTSEADQALEDILTDISANYHSGTAGCSLSAAKYAGEILDWSVTVTNASDAAQKTVNQFYASLNTDAAAELGDKLSDVHEAARLLCGSTGADLLSDCGYQAKSFPWNQTAMESVFTAMTGALPTSSVS